VIFIAGRGPPESWLARCFLPHLPGPNLFTVLFLFYFTFFFIFFLENIRDSFGNERDAEKGR
jgi:hypothetical protein